MMCDCGHEDKRPIVREMKVLCWPCSWKTPTGETRLIELPVSLDYLKFRERVKKRLPHMFTEEAITRIMRRIRFAIEKKPLKLKSRGGPHVR